VYLSEYTQKIGDGYVNFEDMCRQLIFNLGGEWDAPCSSSEKLRIQ